ncbi:V-type ATP synthase subunit I [Methanobrevibacter sp.]
MFQTERMRKLRIVTLDAYAQNIVNVLHEEGIVQIDDISERIQQDPEIAELVTPSKATSQTGQISSLLMKTSSISDTFGNAQAFGNSIKDTLHSVISPDLIVPKQVDDLDTDALIIYAESVLDDVGAELDPLQEKLSALDTEKSRLTSKITVANKLTNLNVDLGTLRDTNTTSTIVGRIDVESASEVKAELNKITDEIVIDEVKQNNEFISIIVITSNEYKDNVYSSLRKFNFDSLDVDDMEGTPSQFISSAQSRLDTIESEKSQLQGQLKELAKKWDDDILALKEQLENEKEKNEIFSSFAQTKNSKFFEAWIPVKKVDEATQLIEKASEGYCVIEVEDVPDNSEDVPVLQNHSGYAKPYELIVQMYSPLKYNEIDPTLFVAITFPFFFGFCLTDLFYGFLNFLVGYFVLYRGLGRNSEDIRSYGKIFMACGIWAMVLGAITNAMLGDFYDRILGLGPLPTTIPWLDSFHNAATILVIAIIVGFIYLNIGFLLGAINNFRNGDKKEALSSQIVWFVFEFGIIFLALGYMVPSVGMIGFVLGGLFIIASLGLLMWGSGAYGMMDVFSYMGDLLSFARLLALCLATGGVAMTVNIITNMCNTMIPIPIVGLILAIIVFIGGHFVNWLFQTLGATVNALRLNYVEFFAQFYQGGKNKFEAFKAQRKFTKINK